MSAETTQPTVTTHHNVWPHRARIRIPQHPFYKRRLCRFVLSDHVGRFEAWCQSFSQDDLTMHYMGLCCKCRHGTYLLWDAWLPWYPCLILLFQSNSLSDCIAGVLIGAALWWAKISHGDSLDSFVINGSVWAPLLLMSITIFLIRVHPEPADACCKCFEDGVAFAGVFIGIKFAQWHHPISHTPQIANLPPAPFAVYLLKLALKILLGTSGTNSWLNLH